MKRAIILFVIIGASFSFAGAQSNGVSVESAFMAIVEAEDAGGDISGLVPLLNEAIDYSADGQTGLAEQALDELVGLSEVSKAVGVREANVTVVVTGVTVAFLLGLVYLTWRYFDSAFWRAWRYTKRGFVVEHP